MLAKVVQCLPVPNGRGAALTRAAIGCQCPEISHAIPLWVLQLLKSERWNSAVFRVLQGMVAGELHAKLVRIDVLTPLCVRRHCCVSAAPAWPSRRLAARLPGLRGTCGAFAPPRAYCAACSAACSASRAAARAFLARAWAATSSGVRGPCTDPSLPSVRSHAMARPSRAPNRAR